MEKRIKELKKNLSRLSSKFESKLDRIKQLKDRLEGTEALQEMVREGELDQRLVEEILNEIIKEFEELKNIRK